MTNQSSDLRRKATEIIKNKSRVEINETDLRNFFYYLDSYCAEMKLTEFDVLLNDENYDFFYNLFESVMIQKSVSSFNENAKVVYYSFL